MRASSELHLRSVWSFPFDFQSTPPREGALVYGLSLLMLPFSGDFHPSFHRHARRNSQIAGVAALRFAPAAMGGDPVCLRCSGLLSGKIGM